MLDFFAYANSGRNTRGRCLNYLLNTAGSPRACSCFVEPGTSMPATVQDFSSLRVFKAFLKTIFFSTCLAVLLTN